MIIGFCRQTRAEAAQAAERAEARAECTAALDVDFYRPEHRSKPLEQARFVVARFEWRGGMWRRARKFGGPKLYADAVADLQYRMRSSGLPYITDV